MGHQPGGDRAVPGGEFVLVQNVVQNAAEGPPGKPDGDQADRQRQTQRTAGGESAGDERDLAPVPAAQAEDAAGRPRGRRRT